MRLLLILTLSLFLVGCCTTKKPRVEIKTVQADAELIAMALSPPRVTLVRSNPVTAPKFKVFVDKETNKVVYQLTEDQAIDLLDFIVDNNNAISQRNKALYIYKKHLLEMRNRAEDLNKELAK